MIYTVIGLAPDSHWDGEMRDATFVEFMAAKTPTVAAHAARKQFAPEYDCEPDDIAILAVFEGRHADRYEPLLDNAEYCEQMELESC